MSEEEPNQELSTDDLKDISGGAQMGELRSDHFKSNNLIGGQMDEDAELVGEAKWANRLTLQEHNR